MSEWHVNDVSESVSRSEISGSVEVVRCSVQCAKFNYVIESANKLTYVFLQLRPAILSISPSNVWRHRACDDADVPKASGNLSLNLYANVVPVKDVKKVAKASNSLTLVSPEVVNDDHWLADISIPPLYRACRMNKVVIVGILSSNLHSKRRFSRTRWSIDPYACPGFISMHACFLELEKVKHNTPCLGNSIRVCFKSLLVACCRLYEP